IRRRSLQPWHTNDSLLIRPPEIAPQGRVSRNGTERCRRTSGRSITVARGVVVTGRDCRLITVRLNRWHQLATRIFPLRHHLITVQQREAAGHTTLALRQLRIRTLVWHPETSRTVMLAILRH